MGVSVRIPMKSNAGTRYLGIKTFLMLSVCQSGIHTIYIRYVRASAITPECIMQAAAIYAKARKKLGSFRVFIKYRKR